MQWFAETKKVLEELAWDIASLTPQQDLDTFYQEQSKKLGKQTFFIIPRNCDQQSKNDDIAKLQQAIRFAVFLKNMKKLGHSCATVHFFTKLLAVRAV